MSATSERRRPDVGATSARRGPTSARRRSDVGATSARPWADVGIALLGHHSYRICRNISRTGLRTPKIGSGFSISLFIRQGESIDGKCFAKRSRMRAYARAASVIAPAGRTLENGWNPSVIMRISSN